MAVWLVGALSSGFFKGVIALRVHANTRFFARVLLCGGAKTKKAPCAFEPPATPALVHSAVDAFLPETPADSPQVNRPAEWTSHLHLTLLVARLTL